MQFLNYMVFNHVILEIHHEIPEIHVYDNHVILETSQSKGEGNRTVKVMATAMAMAT
jgi:hypothetical protein